MKRIAFYGGSFDPVHIGHYEVALQISKSFDLDEFYFLPAFQAPHKSARPSSAFHRCSMLALATAADKKIKTSHIEVSAAERQYTFDTLNKLKEIFPDDELFFVMGADSWQEITTWYRWEEVLRSVNIIVVSRPGYQLDSGHVTVDIRSRIADPNLFPGKNRERDRQQIYVTDQIEIDVSATKIRKMISEGVDGWQEFVPAGVAKYIEKYELYK